MADIPTLAEMLLGEPQEPEIHSRDYQVNVRLDTRQYAKLNALAQLTRENKSAFTRMLLEAAIRQFVRSLPPEVESKFEALEQKHYDGLLEKEDNQ